MSYVQFQSVGDFIPEPRCSKFAVGLQTNRNEKGGVRGPVGLRSEWPRVTDALTCTKYWSVCSMLLSSSRAIELFESSGHQVLELSDLSFLFRESF